MSSILQIKGLGFIEIENGGSALQSFQVYCSHPLFLNFSTVCLAKKK